MKRLLLVLLLITVVGACWALAPPRTLTAETKGSSVVLAWKYPAEAGILSWDSGTYGDAIGYGPNTPVDIMYAVRFEESDLEPYDNEFLHALQFYPAVTNASYTITIHRGGNARVPGAVIRTINLTNFTAGEYNQIDFDTSIPIDATLEMWIVVRAVATGGYICAVDNSSQSDTADGKGNLIFFRNTWTSMAANNLYGNWMIRGLVESDDPHNPETRDLDNLLSYNVYRDGVPIANINPDWTILTADINPPPGEHTYTVRAMYDVGESEDSNSAIVHVASVPMIAPTNLLADTVSVSNVYLEWDNPRAIEPDSEVLFWDNYHIVGNSIGTASDQFTVAQRFDQIDLSDLDGRQLTQVGFVPNDYSVFTIKVWQGGVAESITQPVDEGVLVAEKWVFDAVPNEWNIIELDMPINIDATQELWIGYTVNGTRGGSDSFPVGCDNGPGLNWRGNLIKSGGNWSLINVQGTLDYNWLIHGFVEEQLTSNRELVTIRPSLAGFPVSVNPDTNYSFHQYPANHVYPQVSTNREMLGYQVYRNDVYLATIDGLDNNFYFDQFVQAGTYTYQVVANFHAGLSAPTNVASVVVGEMSVLPPASLQARVEDINKIKVTWEIPDPTNAEELMMWDDGECLDGMGTGNNQFQVAQRFCPADLTQFENHVLRRVSFYPRATGVYRVRVWRGGRMQAEQAFSGEMIIDQAIDNVQMDQWNTVLLHQPVEIDLLNELWIGYLVDSTDQTNTFPAGIDGSDAVNFKGNLVSFSRSGNTWSSLSAGDNGINGNWLIHGWVSPAISAGRESRSLTGYQLYCNDEMIFETSDPLETSITDIKGRGTYDYGIRAYYGDDNYSEMIGTAPVTVDFPSPQALTAIIPSNHTRIILRWTAPDTANREMTAYRVYKNGEIVGNVFTTTFMDTDVSEDTIEYKVCAIYDDVFESRCSNTLWVTAFVGADDTPAPLQQTSLGEAFPNPFNPSTRINFNLKESQHVSLQVFNSKGQKVTTLTNQQYPAGSHLLTWEGNDTRGNAMPSGVYFYRLITERYTSTKKMLLLK